MTPLSRRRFLQLAGAGAVFTAARPLLAIEPIKRTGGPILKLSLAAYSFRNSMKDSTTKQQPVEGPKMDMKQFIDYCAEHGCAGAELTSYFFPKDANDDYFRDVRAHADQRGIAISGSAVGNNFALPAGPELDYQKAEVKRWIDKAAILGAPHIRVFAGAAKNIDPADARKMCIASLEEVCDYAGKHKIMLGLENHGGIVAEADGLLEIVNAVKSPWFAVNLDTGNFHTADPYGDLAKCAPYAVNVQVKVDMFPNNKKEPADLPRVVQILRDANYQGWVALEYEANEDPYQAVPRHLGTLAQLIGAKPATAGADARPIFDGKSLAGWKITEFSGRGDVAVENGQMILEAGNDITGANYTGETPKMNYEIALEAMKLQGTDFFCALTFPVGDVRVTFVVGGWGGSVVGISSVNGDDASENETTQFLKFDNNKWYKLRVRITEPKIEAWVDDAQVVNLELKDKRLGMRPGEIELSEPFGIATYRTRAALRNITLKKL
jgi:sugar phosphate isomerase/epimerase